MRLVAHRAQHRWDLLVVPDSWLAIIFTRSTYVFQCSYGIHFFGREQWLFRRSCAFSLKEKATKEKKKQSRQQGKNSSNFISWKCDFVLYIDKFSCPVPTVESFLLYHMYSITFPIIQHMQNKIKIKITVQEQDEQEHQQNWKQQRILLHLVAVK